MNNNVHKHDAHQNLSRFWSPLVSFWSRFAGETNDSSNPAWRHIFFSSKQINVVAHAKITTGSSPPPKQVKLQNLRWNQYKKVGNMDIICKCKYIHMTLLYTFLNPTVGIKPSADARSSLFTLLFLQLLSVPGATAHHTRTRRCAHLYRDHGLWSSSSCSLSSSNLVCRSAYAKKSHIFWEGAEATADQRCLPTSATGLNIMTLGFQLCLGQLHSIHLAQIGRSMVSVLNETSLK